MRTERSCAHFVDFAFDILEPAEHGIDTVGQLIRSNLHHVGKLLHKRMFACKEPISIGSDEGFDATHACTNRTFGQELHDTEIAGRASVRTAAEFPRPFTDGHHAHGVAILLAEQRHRTDLAGGVL